MKTQVEKEHYGFSSYVTKERWISYWHQLDEVLRLCPSSVLEIGGGPGIFRNIASLFRLRVATVDIDAALNPDHVASITALPFTDKSHDVVAAFQMLEHLPFGDLPLAVAEMSRVAQRYVVVSLPDVQVLWRYLIHVPRIGDIRFSIKRPTFGRQTHIFDGEHHWEIGKQGYALKTVLEVFSRQGLHLIKTYQVPENPYHRFFIFGCSLRENQPGLPPSKKDANIAATR